MSGTEQAKGFAQQAGAFADRFAQKVDDLFDLARDDADDVTPSDGRCTLDLRRPADLFGSGLRSDVSAALVGGGSPGTPVRELVGHDGWVRCLTLADDGRHLISGSNDGTVRVWDLGTGDLCGTFQVRPTAIRAVAVAPSGLIFAASRDRILTRFNPRRNAAATTPGEVLLRHRSELRSIVLTSDGAFTILASDDAGLRLWPTRGSANFLVAEGHTEAVTSLAITPDDQRLVSGSEDGTVGIWDLEHVKIGFHTFAAGHRMWINDVAITDDGDTVASVDESGELRIWDLSYSPFSEPIDTGLGALACVEFSADEQLVLVGAENGFVVAYDRLTGQTVGGSRLHDHPVTAMAVLSDNRHFATGSADRSIRVWRTGDLT